jgi:CubicO group peptidase (beta-lactamase class C family)
MPDPERVLEAIESFIAKEMRAGQTPGLGLSIRRAGEVILERGYGYADLEARRPMTAFTGVVIGSTTKALTCTALLQLVEAGRLDLDAPVQRYLPDFRIADPEASAGMTIRQCVTHTAGLPPSAAAVGRFLFWDDASDNALARSIADLAAMQPLWAPGGTWVYANDGYIIAGRVIEVVAGMPFEDYMSGHILEPLGLSATGFSHALPGGLDVAVPYDFDAQGSPYASFFAHNRAGAAAGAQLVICAHDAGVWLQTVLAGGRGPNGAVLSEASVRELVRPNVPIPEGIRDSSGTDSSYALGWQVGMTNGIPTISHGGAAITMGSHFALAPHTGISVAVVANSVSEVTRNVSEGTLSLLHGVEPARHFPVVDRSFVPDRSHWSAVAGIYQATQRQNTVTGPWPIRYEQGQLFTPTYPGDARRRPGIIWLFPVEDTSFVLFGRGRTGGRVSFTVEGTNVSGVWQGVPIVKSNR